MYDEDELEVDLYDDCGDLDCFIAFVVLRDWDNTLYIGSDYDEDEANFGCHVIVSWNGTTVIHNKGELVYHGSKNAGAAGLIARCVDADGFDADRIAKYLSNI